MSMFALNDSEDDLKREGGQFVRTTGVDSIRTHVIMRLKMIQREAFTAVNLGIAWLSDFLGKQNETVVRALVDDQVSETPGIESATTNITAYDGQTRKISISFTAQASTGETVTGESDGSGI